MSASCGPTSGKTGGLQPAFGSPLFPIVDLLFDQTQQIGSVVRTFGVAWDWKKRGTGLQMIPNMARAHGVEMWVQSQLPAQMAPTVRANCQNIFCFLLQEPAALDWAAKSYGDQFRKVQDLKPGQYIGKRGLELPFIGWAWYHDKNGKFRRVD